MEFFPHGTLENNTHVLFYWNKFKVVLEESKQNSRLIDGAKLDRNALLGFFQYRILDNNIQVMLFYLKKVKVSLEESKQNSRFIVGAK